MERPKITRQDIYSHYTNGLAQHYLEFGDYKELYLKVQQVKFNPKFQDFMVEQFNKGREDVEVLNDYFNKDEIMKKTQAMLDRDKALKDISVLIDIIMEDKAKGQDIFDKTEYLKHLVNNL